MSQYNINNLQTTYSYDEYVKNYLNTSLSALANSGQRFGINGESIKYSNISCVDIFNIDYNQYDITNLLLKLKMSGDKLSGKLVRKNNNKLEEVTNIVFNNNEDIKFNDAINFKSIKSDNTIISTIYNLITNIDQISDDSYIIFNNDTCTVFIKGRLNQTDNNGLLVYIQYDIQNNKLLHYIITQKYNTLQIDDYNDWYIVYELNLTGTNIYELDIRLFRLEWLVTYIQNSLLSDTINFELNLTKLIQNFYTYNIDNEEINENEMFSFFKNIFINYDNFRADTNDIDNISFLNYIFKYNSNKILSTYGLIQFNTIYINLNDDIFSFANNNLPTDIQGYIDENDLTVYMAVLQNLFTIYVTLSQYYSQTLYFNDNTNYFLFKRIIYTLYNKLREEYNISGLLSDELYIPLKYTFNCFLNDIHLNKLYFIDTIYISLLSNINNISPFNSNNKIYYVFPLITDHTSIYDVHINYNTYNDININDILVNKLYTLPYINKLNQWVIDDSETNLSINNQQYSGIKELFVYVDNVNEDKPIINILNTEDNINSLLNFTKEKEFYVDPKYFSTRQNDVTCKAILPELKNINNEINLNNTTDLIEFFKNTIIIEICKKDNLNKSALGYEYMLDYVYSLWKLEYTSINGELECDFKNITLNDKYAYDPFNNLSVINNEQQYKFIQKLSTVKPINKDNSVKKEDINYLLLRNKLGKYYSDEYKNNYNVSIEYAPTANNDGSNPTYNDNKFISQIENITTTNSIYPKYDIYFRAETKTEVERVIKKVIKSTYKKYIQIIVNGKNKIFTEITNTLDENNVYDIVENELTSTKYVEIGIILDSSTSNTATAQYYNEYVFNNNVPTIDLKETFIRNTNALNRINILGIQPANEDSAATIYNGFIGTKHTDSNGSNKNTLYISTEATNINVGTNTLLDINQYNKFSLFNSLQIDGFNNINLQSRHNAKIELKENNISITANKLNFDTNYFEFNNNIFAKSFINKEVKRIDDNNTLEIFNASIIPNGIVYNNYIGEINIIDGRLFVLADFTDSSSSVNNITGIIINNSRVNANILSNQNIFIPIYGLEINQATGAISDVKLLYNSINLTLLLNSIFKDAFDTSILQSDNCTYILNGTNQTLDITLGKKTYKLLVFNDSNIENLDNQQQYYIFNHKLNISVILNSSNNTCTVYVNFEYETIDTVKTYEQINTNTHNSIEKGSIEDIYYAFSRYIDNTVRNNAGDKYTIRFNNQVILV